MSDVACALETLKCAYQTASSALKEGTKTIAAIHDNLVCVVAPVFAELDEEVQSNFLKQIALYMNQRYGERTMPEAMVNYALRKKSLRVPGVIPTEISRFRTHVRHVERFLDKKPDDEEQASDTQSEAA